jgi:D-sedoheptulose 7-phosphate isomerase
VDTGQNGAWRHSAQTIIAHHSSDLIQAGDRLCGDAEMIARTCHEMAQRFRQGGKLLVFADSLCTTAAQHVAVEFLHPVIVGKRALPAVALTNDIAALITCANRGMFDRVFAEQVCCLGRPLDIAMSISFDGHCTSVIEGLRTAHKQGLLTVALCGGDGGTIVRNGIAEIVLTARATDPLSVKELQMLPIRSAKMRRSS